uniref:Carbonic anhydrase 8 n=1 Tax=Sus scrofa TaxID=9823 RepID=A0A8D1DL65_PIG
MRLWGSPMESPSLLCSFRFFFNQVFFFNFVTFIHPTVNVRKLKNMEIGKEHVGLKAVTEILQDIQYKGKSKTIPCFNPNTLLPDPLLRDYWVYEGSLTIPPCSEGVTWILFRYPLTISQLQIEEFRRLRTHVKGAELVEGCDGILGDNFRPTQPLSDRVIRAAFQ